MSYMARSPLAHFFGDIVLWLHDEAAPQSLISVFACCTGVLLAGCGPMVWTPLNILYIAMLGAGFVHYEDLTLHITQGQLQHLVLAAGAGCTLGLAALLGFEGTQTLLGAIVGLLGSYGTGFWARTMDSSAKPGHQFACLLWYSFGLVSGILIFIRFRRIALCTLTPVIGTFLLISGGGYLAMSKMSSKHLTWPDVAGSLLGDNTVYLLAYECGVALIGSLVYALCNNSKYAAIVVAVAIGTGFLSTATGFGCGWLINECPAWLMPTSAWQWPCIGGVLWMGIAAAATHWQFTVVLPKLDGKDIGQRGLFLGLSHDDGIDQPQLERNDYASRPLVAASNSNDGLSGPAYSRVQDRGGHM